MVPLLAAAGAVGTISSLFDKLTGKGHAAADGHGKGATDFAALLKGQGVDVSRHLHGTAAGGKVASAVSGVVNQVV